MYYNSSLPVEEQDLRNIENCVKEKSRLGSGWGQWIGHLGSESVCWLWPLLRCKGQFNPTEPQILKL